MKIYFLLVLLFFSFQANAENTQNYGTFIGNFNFQALGDGRKIKLLNEIIFIDFKGKKWIAPKGHIVDGASIPRNLWSIIGSPLVGKYRIASVIHDVACDGKTQSWQATHRVFYEAMLASGVTKRKAEKMYTAVYNFGPRWGENLEKRLSKDEFKMVISDPYKKGIKHLITFGSLKKYDGSALYVTKKNKNIVIGGVKRINDMSIKAEIGKEQSNVSFKYNTIESPHSYYIEKGIGNNHSASAGYTYDPNKNIKTRQGLEGWGNKNTNR